MISCLELTVSLCQQSLVSGMRPELYTNRNLLVCIYFVVRDHTAEAIYSSDSALNATRRKGTPGLRPQSTAAGPAPPCKQRPTLSPHNTSCIYSLWILNYATQHNLLWYHFNGKDFFFSKCFTNWHAIPNYNPSSVRDTEKDRGKLGSGT